MRKQKTVFIALLTRPTSTPSSPKTLRIPAARKDGKRVSKNLYIYQRGEYDEGMHTFAEPLNIDAVYNDYHSLTATILYNLGQLCMRLEEDEEASEFFLQALAISQWSGNRKGAKSLNSMAILHNLGHVQYRCGNYEESVRTYNKALAIGRASFSEFHLEVAATLNCLGVLYFHMPKAETKQAMELYTESLTIRRAVLGNEHKDVATTLNNIGRIHYMKAEYGEALRLYREALDIRRRLLGNNK